MYSKRQIGWMILIPLPLLLLAIGGASMNLPDGPLRTLLPVILSIPAIALIAFSTLNVTVGDTNVRVAFTLPFIAREIPLADLADARTVRNKWWFGWGIRYLGESGWMWNVQGLDAVELDLKSGKKFRIGTDDPEGLLAAIKQRLN